MKKLLAGWKSESGYSLTEMMVVVGIAGTLSAMAVVQVGNTRSGLRGDAAMRLVMSQMNQAREASITQRRNMRLVFDTTFNRIQTLREEVGSPTPPPTVLSTIYFEGGVKFVKNVTASPAGDSLDGFATTGAVTFSSATEIKFTPEGRFVNQDGASLNGVVLTGIPTDALSSRGVSIMGSTGRIRAFRWDGRKWVQV